MAVSARQARPKRRGGNSGNLARREFAELAPPRRRIASGILDCHLRKVGTGAQLLLDLQRLFLRRHKNMRGAGVGLLICSRGLRVILVLEGTLQGIKEAEAGRIWI